MYLPLGTQAAAGLSLSTADGSFWTGLRSAWASRAKITCAGTKKQDEVGRFEGNVGVFNLPWIGGSVNYLSDTVLLYDRWLDCWGVQLPVCSKNLPSILHWVKSAQICHNNGQQDMKNTLPVRKCYPWPLQKWLLAIALVWSHVVTSLI